MENENTEDGEQIINTNKSRMENGNQFNYKNLIIKIGNWENKL